jgi:hypothetical protein
MPRTAILLSAKIGKMPLGRRFKLNRIVNGSFTVQRRGPELRRNRPAGMRTPRGSA